VEGTPADLFFSADEAKIGKLEKAGFLVPGSREDLLGNTLVIIVPAKVQAAFEKYGFGVSK
jgi:molybdate transport system substrate-binding protein